MQGGETLDPVAGGVPRARSWAIRHAAGLVALALLVLAVPAAAGGDRASVVFSLQRNELLSDRLALLRELKVVDAEIADGEKPVTVSGTIGRANTVHNMRAGYVVRLRSRRQRLLDRIEGLDRRFETLTDRVVAHYGEAPPWWSDIK